MFRSLLDSALTTTWPGILNIPDFTSATPTSKVMNIPAMSKKSALIINDTSESAATTTNSFSNQSSNDSVSRKELIDLYDSSETLDPIAHREIIIKQKMNDVHSTVTVVETTATIIDEEKFGHLAVLNHYTSTCERHPAYDYLKSLGSPVFQQQMHGHTVISHPMAIAINQI